MTSVSSLLGESSGVYKPRSREGFAYIDTTKPCARDVMPITRLAPMDHAPVEVTEDQQPSMVQPLTMAMQQQGFPQPAGKYKPQCTPVTDLLLPETSTMVYTDEFFNQPAARLFLQNIQPNIYSYSVDTTPINNLANGITYTPQRPPKFRDQVYNRPDGMTYPIYTRIDPQLIRDQGVPARLLEQPVRSDWSAKYSSWDPPAGSVNVEDIYDGRFTGYGDPYRSYSDVTLGNVNYYYSDVDAFRSPNYVTRSKTDFIEYVTPMGQVKPYYERTAGLNDTRPLVATQFDSDQIYFRENISSSQMDKRNSELWQLRFAPLSRSSNTRSFTSGPT